jgi:hypothetical protein
MNVQTVVRKCHGHFSGCLNLFSMVNELSLVLEMSYFIFMFLNEIFISEFTWAITLDWKLGNNNSEMQQFFYCAGDCRVTM